MGVFGGAAEAALNASPAGKAYGVLKSIFGKKPPTWKRSQTLVNYEAARDAGRTGDQNAIEYLARMAGLRRPEFPGTKYPVIRERARVAYMNLSARFPARGNRTQGDIAPRDQEDQWDDTSGTAPAARERLTRPMKPPSAPPARRAKKSKTKPRSAYLALTSGLPDEPRRGKRPCKYGPRGADGYCPKKPRAEPRERVSKTQLRAERKLRSAITTGVTRRAAKLTPAQLASAGAFAAKAGLVLAAGVAAYLVTSKLLKLRYRTYDELRYQAALAYKNARREAGEVNGRGLTPAESAQLASWFRARLARLAEHEAAGDKVSGVVNLTFED